MLLVHEVVDDPLARGTEIAGLVAEYSPTAIQSGLNFVGQVRGVEPGRSGEIAQAVRNEVFASADFKEGLRAFQEKRGPRWPSIGKT